MLMEMYNKLGCLPERNPRGNNMTNNNEDRTDYIRVAIESIITYHECPICDYTASNKEYVIDHIVNKHSQQELKEICSE